MSNHLTPLDVCITIFGSRAAIEQIVGSRPKGSYAWSKPAAQRQAGDLPPHVTRKIFDYARRHKIKIDPVFLILGASRDQMETWLRRNGGTDVAAE